MTLHFKTNGLSVVETAVNHDSFYGESVTDKKAYRPTSGVAIQLNGVGSPVYDDAEDLANHAHEIASLRGNFDITEIDAKITKQNAQLKESVKDVERRRKKVIDDAIKDAEVKERQVTPQPKSSVTAE